MPDLFSFPPHAAGGVRWIVLRRTLTVAVRRGGGAGIDLGGKDHTREVDDPPPLFTYPIPYFIPCLIVLFQIQKKDWLERSYKID